MAEPNPERNSRINRAVVGRIAAVGFFVVLGTFAVMQSLGGNADVHDHASDDSHDDSDSSSTKNDTDSEDSVERSSGSELEIFTASDSNPAENDSESNVIRTSSSDNLSSPTSKFSAPPIKQTVFQDSAQDVQQAPKPRSFGIPKTRPANRFELPKSQVGELKTSADEKTIDPVSQSKGPLPPIRGSNSFRTNPKTGSNFAPSLKSRKNTSSPPSGNFSVGDSAPPKSNSFSFQSRNKQPEEKKVSDTDDSGFGTGGKLLPPIRNTSTQDDSSRDRNSPRVNNLPPPPSTNPRAFKDEPKTSPPGPRSKNSILETRPSGSSARELDSQARSTSLEQTKRNDPATRQSANIRNDSSRSFSSAPVRSDTIPAINASSRSNNASTTSVRTLATPGGRELEGAQTPSVRLQKLAPREVQINKPANFELIVSNVGKATADDVVVFDRVPSGTELIEADPEPKRNADGSLSWQLGSLTAGATQKIRMKLMPTTPGEIGSVAQVTFSAKASARTICTKPELSISHRTAEKVLLGGDVILDIDVENKGNGAATNVTIQEDVPIQLDFPQGVRELEYPIGNLAPGEKRNIKLRLRAAKTGRFRNVMVAHGDGKLRAQHAVDMEVVAPKIEVVGEGPTRKYLNRKATHEFSVRNTGTASATNVELVAKLPRGLKFVETNNQGQYDPRTHAVYWELQELDTKLTGKVQVTTLPIESGEHSINFEASADLNQNATTSRSLQVEHLDELFCEIDDLTDPVEIGGETAYQIKVVNQGLKTANNIQLQVSMPAGMETTTINGAQKHQIQGQKILFAPITRLEPKQEIAITIRAKGIREGDHRVVVSMKSDDRKTPVSKEESTQVYSDR